jgi:predicted phosphodiesterase
MKILFTSDLHFNISGRKMMDRLQEALREEAPDVLVIAGDLMTADKAWHLDDIKEDLDSVGGHFTTAFCLGNHDLWLPPEEHAPHRTFQSIIDRYWTPLAERNGMILLDQKNLDLGTHVLVGGYGHFDLGHAFPGLTIDGKLVTEEHYLKGGWNFSSWNDFRRIPRLKSRYRIEAQLQAEGLARRMDEAIQLGKRLLVATHTLPWQELNGYPYVGGKEEDMFRAYSGNSLLGSEVAARAEHIDYLVCGHTHKHVPESVLHGVRSINLGGDYGQFRGVIFDTTDLSSRMIGPPVKP